MQRVPRLGVGIVWLPALTDVLARHADVFDVIEIEPQTLWLRGADGRVWSDRPRLDRVRASAPRCLVHGVGYPVGTSRPAFPEVAGLFSETVDHVEAAWASEHLSFTRGALGGQVRDAGFLLPPLQTDEGVRASCRAITQAAATVKVPFAVENGVSYLRRSVGEMDDGDFLRAVTEGPDCGIVLDLHNAWCNDRNGRQPIERFLSQVPIERVVEIHLAGGQELNGFWLDAHSGAVPDPVMAIARELMPSLPNLGAAIFEVSPSSLRAFGEDDILREIDRIRKLWPSTRPADVAPSRGRSALPAYDEATALQRWEDSLVAALAGQSRDWAGDPGIGVYRQLIKEFRQGTVTSILPFTCRYLMLKLGVDAFEGLLDDVFAATSPDPFASGEARRFGARAEVLLDGEPGGSALLAFELELVAMLTSGIARQFDVGGDVVSAMLALADGRMPDGASANPTTVEMSPAGVEFRDARGDRIASWAY
jgi:uncharacterized protein